MMAANCWGLLDGLRTVKAVGVCRNHKWKSSFLYNGTASKNNIFCPLSEVGFCFILVLSESAGLY